MRVMARKHPDTCSAQHLAMVGRRGLSDAVAAAGVLEARLRVSAQDHGHPDTAEPAPGSVGRGTFRPRWRIQ